MTVTVREPTGAIPPPIMLFTGAAGTGKSYQAAQFTGSPKVGDSFWIEIGKDERTADWYKRVPGAKYLIVDHNGTWPEIVEAAKVAAARAKASWVKTKKVPVIVVDSANGEWRMLSRYAEWKARNTKAARGILSKDPNAEIQVSSTHWNAATKRHQDFLDALADSPAIVVLLCRSELVTVFDAQGQPKANEKTWSIQGQRGLLGYVDVAAQLHLAEEPELLKLRDVTGGVIPGKDAALRLKQETFSLEWLVFERYGLDPENMAQREVKPMDANMLMPDDHVVPEDGGGYDPPRPPWQRRMSDEEMVTFAHQGVDKLLAAADRDSAVRLWEVIKNHEAAGLNVADRLTGEDREVLGVQDDQSVTLLELANMVGPYVKKHGRAVRAPLDAAPQLAEVAAA